jgi:hypothetical protein
MSSNNPPPREELEFTLTAVDRGKITVRLLDRITVDDVFGHLVGQEVYRVVSGKDVDPEVNPLFKDYLLTERFTIGIN